MSDKYWYTYMATQLMQKHSLQFGRRRTSLLLGPKHWISQPPIQISCRCSCEAYRSPGAKKWLISRRHVANLARKKRAYICPCNKPTPANTHVELKEIVEGGIKIQSPSYFPHSLCWRPTKSTGGCSHARKYMLAQETFPLDIICLQFVLIY